MDGRQEKLRYVLVGQCCNLGDKIINCFIRYLDWSIIYVGSMISILGMVVVGTSCYYSCKKKHGSFSRGISVMANGHGMRGAANGGPKARRAGSAKYSRLNTEDDHLELRSE